MILKRVLDGEDLGVRDAARLLREGELDALQDAANRLRQEQVGDIVTYVVNRNINFTNVCAKSCHFCAFARGRRSGEGYFLPVTEIVRRAVEAAELGATEVCVQAGLAPIVDGSDYLRILRAIKAAAPDLHVHAFSPSEIVWGARRGGDIRGLLDALRDAGLGSLPGTSAEVLDDGVRRRLAPGRITTAQWLEVIRTAHELGIPTTSTMMFGHLETPEHQVRHMALLRQVQRETGGFTEFVPLSFVHTEAPLFARTEGVRPGPSGRELRAFYAVARLFLGRDIPNLQASWVKQGLDIATELLNWGCNDLGGTLMNESISTSAGAGHGQLVRPAVLRQAIASVGRKSRERTTLYRELLERTYPLDITQESFGSYPEITGSSAFRYSQAVEGLAGAPIEELQALRAEEEAV